MKEFLSIFKAEQGSYSSKRVCGVLAWMVVLSCYVYCCIADKQMPVMTEFLVGASVTLLGVDSVASIFKNNNNEEQVN